ncbi:MAG: hypothetical protein AAFX87_04545 [Bacteroidota bacterium]
MCQTALYDLLLEVRYSRMYLNEIIRREPGIDSFFLGSAIHSLREAEQYLLFLSLGIPSRTNTNRSKTRHS